MMTKRPRYSVPIVSPRAWILLVLWWPPVLCWRAPDSLEAGDPPRRPEPREDSEKDDGDLSLRIVVLPAVVYANSTVRVRVEVEPATRSALRIRWQADAGLLFFDDLRETEWKAPPAAGRCELRVAATDGNTKNDADGRTCFKRRSVTVRRPSTERMRWIPSGSFIRGDVWGTENAAEVKTIQNASDEPSHRVYLRGFWIDRYPVTNREYAGYLEDALRQQMVRVTPLAVRGEFEGDWVPFYYFKSYEDLVGEYLSTVNARVPRFLHMISWDPDKQKFHIRAGHEESPVVDVSWFGAAGYAKFYGKSLPTEAQWEKAARGTDVRSYPWGDHLPTPYHVNVNHFRGDDPTPVGTFSPAGDSPYGVGDMVAGLFEWTNDWFNADYYEDYRADGLLRNPHGPFWGTAHAIRSFPSAILHSRSTMSDVRPVSARYHWRFEFFVRDIFANRSTTFRTAICPHDKSYEYDDEL